jgi:formylglycine-generating enzyme required for sulfatase activity/tRNA A-37 threonylcarbamoyl transferase component Bud32
MTSEPELPGDPQGREAEPASKRPESAGAAPDEGSATDSPPQSGSADDSFDHTMAGPIAGSNPSANDAPRPADGVSATPTTGREDEEPGDGTTGEPDDDAVVFDRTMAGPATTPTSTDTDTPVDDEDLFDHTMAGPAPDSSDTGRAGSGSGENGSEKAADDNAFDATMAGPGANAESGEDGSSREDRAEEPVDHILAGSGPRTTGAGGDTIEIPPPEPHGKVDDENLTLEQRRARAARAGDTRPEPPTDMRPPVAPPGMRLSPAESALLGRTLGDCKIEQLLGRGAMGAVFRAKQLHLDRTVAVKTIRPDRLLDDSLLKRFQLEARLVSRFTSPHVVQVYGAGEQDGLFYFVMQYVPGGTISEYAKSLPERRISERDAVRYLRECVLALEEAHELQTLHRDIKPENILLDAQGRAMLSDFGIAKALDQRAQLTMSMDQVGTPLYMSPEQCSNMELDFRSDMWSLGATFFYLATNVPPAQGSSIIELIKNKSETECLSPSSTLAGFGDDSPFSKIIERMTALDRDDRYSSWAELQADLDELHAQHQSAPARASETVRRRIAATGRNKPGAKAAETEDKPTGGAGRTLAFAAIALIALGGGGWFALQSDGVREALGLQVARAEPAPIDPDTAGDADSGATSDDPPGDPVEPYGSPDLEDLDGGDPALEDPALASGPNVVVTTGGVTLDTPDSANAGIAPTALDNAAEPPLDDATTTPDTIDPDIAPPLFDSPDAARTALGDYETRFAEEGPTAPLETLVADMLKADLPEDVRSGAYRLSRRIGEVSEARRGLSSIQYVNTPTPPFDALSVYVRRCREHIDVLDGETNTLPGWARRLVERRLPDSLWLRAVDAVDQSLARCRSRVPDTGDAENSDFDRIERDLDAAEQGIERLSELFPQFAESESRRELNTKLRDLRSDIDSIQALHPLETRLLTIERRAQKVTTLDDWLSIQDSDDDLVRALASFDASRDEWLARDPSQRPDDFPLASRRERVGGVVERWEAWRTHVESTTAPILAGGDLEEIADALRRGPGSGSSRSSNGNTRGLPSDVARAAKALDTVASIYATLVENADVNAAGTALREVLRDPDKPFAVLPRRVASRLFQATSEMERLAEETARMTPVPADRVRVEVQTRSSTDVNEVDVAAFLIARFETTRGEWLDFLRAMNGTWTDVDTRFPGVWPSEEVWRRATGDAAVRVVMRDAKEPDLPISSVSFLEASAYARWKGAAVLSHPQWWLAGRGPIDDEKTFPWGESPANTVPSDAELLHASSSAPVPVSQGGYAWRFGGHRSVHHLAGNVAEWVGPATDDGRYAFVVGGSYRDNRSRVNQRRERYAGVVALRLGAAEADKTVGFRLAVSPRDALRERGAWLGK